MPIETVWLESLKPLKIRGIDRITKPTDRLPRTIYASWCCPCFTFLCPYRSGPDGWWRSGPFARGDL